MRTDFDVNRIVVPTDFSDTAYVAVNWAVDIAKNYNAEIILIHVLETGAYQGIFSPSKKTSYSGLEEAQDKLQEDAHKISTESGISVRQEIISSGWIYDEIVRVANEDEADLIVMGTHGVSGWQEFFVGSNAHKVVTQASCPVLSIQEKADHNGFKNIILPIDKTPESRQKTVQAASIAKKFDGTVHIAAVITDEKEESEYEFDKRIKQITDYLTRQDVAFTKTKLHGTNLATMTMNFAEAKDGDLIVMMTEQEANNTGFLMGPFAQQIVNHSKIPVLSISPEDFTTEGDSFHTLG